MIFETRKLSFEPFDYVVSVSDNYTDYNHLGYLNKNGDINKNYDNDTYKTYRDSIRHLKRHHPKVIKTKELLDYNQNRRATFEGK